MSASEFFNMGGYAFYVWSSYALALVILGGVFIAPMLNKKKLLSELRMKYRQQEKQSQTN
jgi:heme exporter protein D